VPPWSTSGRRGPGEILFVHGGPVIGRAAGWRVFAALQCRDAAAFVTGSLLW